MSEKQVKVKVIDRWRVVHDDKAYHKGDTLIVPENVAAEWCGPAGWRGHRCEVRAISAWSMSTATMQPPPAFPWVARW
jgi:hypothetical protein